MSKKDINLHAENPIVDAIIEISPLGDARDIYEGLSGKNYQQAVEGSIGLATTLLGAGAIKSFIKARKLLKKMKNADNIINRKKYLQLSKKAYSQAMSSMTGKVLDFSYDGKSIYERNR